MQKALALLLPRLFLEVGGEAQKECEGGQEHLRHHTGPVGHPMGGKRGNLSYKDLIFFPAMKRILTYDLSRLAWGLPPPKLFLVATHG